MGSVTEFGYWEGERWVWKMRWTQQLTGEEAEIAGALEELLKPICPVRDREDMWCWIASKMQQYTIKSAYCRLGNSSDISLLTESESKILKKFLHTAAPSKYLVHDWRVLIDRLQTRSLLQQRGIMLFQNNPCCVFCSWLQDT